MILDERTEFCDATALNTGGAGTYVIGDVVDTFAPNGINPNATRNLGNGEPLYLVIQVATTATSGGSATGTFQLVSDSTADLATSPTVHVVTDTIAVANLAAGTTRVYPLPMGEYERYLGIRQITATAAFTAGAINAFLTLDANVWRAYADNVS